MSENFVVKYYCNNNVSFVRNLVWRPDKWTKIYLPFTQTPLLLHSSGQVTSKIFFEMLSPLSEVFRSVSFWEISVKHCAFTLSRGALANMVEFDALKERLFSSFTFENFSIVWRCHQYRWRAFNLTYVCYSWPLSSEDSLECHNYCDTGHSFWMIIFKDPLQFPSCRALGSGTTCLSN